MKVSAPINYLSWVALVVVMLLSVFTVALSQDDMKYSGLNEIWKESVLLKDPVKDPRSDVAQLRPVLNYDSEIIQVHSFDKERKGLLVGEGWRLIGSVVDILMNGETKYILYGRRNLRYDPGLWNNVLDDASSFEDYLVIKREDNQTEVLVHKRLIATTAQVLLGLRLTNDANSFEVLQNSQSGVPQVIWTYIF
jgi:hypothetical protein